MKKILILAWGVYPSTGGSTIIVNNLSEAFTPEQLIIAGQIPKIFPKLKWESFSNIRLVYLDPFPFGIRKKPKILRWIKVFKLIKQVESLIQSEGIDRILAIFPDEYYAYIAYKVNQRKALPYDIWFHNSYLENRTGILKALANFLQPKFFSTASRIFVMSDGLKSEMNKKYPTIDFITLKHGFKLPTQLNIKANTEINKDKVKFLYSGSLNNSCLDASLRMMKTIKSFPSYELHIFSGNPESFKKYGIEGRNVIFHSFLPMDKFVEDLVNYDIMLLPHGFDGMRSDFEYKTIFPTRTIPLLFSGKPILAHSPRDSFLSDFLLENKCAKLVMDKSEEKLINAIDQLLSNKSERDTYVHNAIIAADQFKVENIAKQILDF